MIFHPIDVTVQVTMNGAAYRMVTNLDVLTAELDAPLSGPAWSEGWHTDGAYNQAPFKATQLYALAVPSRGGNTLFANAYAAYDDLPMADKAALEGVHKSSNPAYLIAVTVLTSMNQASLNEIGVEGSVENQVLKLAKLAQEAE